MKYIFDLQVKDPPLVTVGPDPKRQLFDISRQFRFSAIFVGMTFSGRFVLSLIHFAGMQGASVQELIALTGHSESELADEELRLEAEVYNAVIESAVLSTGDPYFGLHAGEQMNLAAAGLIAQITQTSRTAKEALEYSCEFAMLGCRAIPMELVKEKQAYKLAFVADERWARQDPLAVRQTIEGMLAFTLRTFHTLTLRTRYPLVVHFDFDQPENLKVYQQLFNCDLKFNQKETALFFRSEDIERPTLTADYDLLRILVNHARQKLQTLENHQSFYHMVKRSVMNLMSPDFPTIDQVAANLNMSVRSLQRKLKLDGYRFKEIIENLRKDFAIDYLKNPDLPITEVAYLLNYADSSAFTRSFKRWMGKTPNEFRIEHYAS